MDNLTHGLLGLSVAALRRPDNPSSPTDRAVILACVIAAELPDLDSLWPAANGVMNALQAHRGFSHSVFTAPLIALVATLLVWPFFRSARWSAVYPYSLAAVIFAHLIPDLWTGWGTRALLPLSYQRFSWDLTMVVDPFVTLPLLAGALYGWRRREHWRQAVLTGLVVVLVYLAGRGAAYGVLQERVASTYPQAERVQVFPTWMGLTTWRYIAVLPASHAAGVVRLTGRPLEEKRHHRAPADLLSPRALTEPTVQEALAWARFPVIAQTSTPEGGTLIRIADLRYHLRGEPTLTFVIEMGPDGQLQSAHLDRGGTAAELLQRWR